MIHDLPFDIIFAPDYAHEVTVTGWTRAEKWGYPRYETRYSGLRFQILTHTSGKWYIKIDNDGTEPVTGFVGVRFPWKHDPDRTSDECYTLIPGVYYDGNVQDDLRPFPILSMPDKPKFEVVLSAATYPTVLVKNGGLGYRYDISAESEAGRNGVTLDAAAGNLTFFAPAREEHIYRTPRPDASRPPYTWHPCRVVTLRIALTEFDCPDIPALFDNHWEYAIRSEIYPAYNTPKVNEQEGAEIVRDWIYKKHCVTTPKGEPLILNAFCDPDEDWPHEGYAEWNIMIGWCSGSMTALPLLKFGGKYRDFAIKFLDFLSTHGNSPSGVKHCVYDGERWMDKSHPEYGNHYTHCRFYSDYLTYLGKAVRLEREAGASHPTWEEDFARGINILCGVWERERDFGTYWDLDGDYPVITRHGNGSGAFCVLALAEAIEHYPNDARLKSCFTEACVEYYVRCVASGRCNAGPIDIRGADDSESIAALADALVKNHAIFGGEENLKMALDAAQMFATWVVNYVPSFPGGTMLEGMNVCGGVVANVRNRHIGPGICTNSARFLYDLGKASGDERWCDLYYRIKAAALNCVTTYDGEFFGITFDTPFARGMLSEQINITDALNEPGETWRVSACWPATAVLLGWAETV